MAERYRLKSIVICCALLAIGAAAPVYGDAPADDPPQQLSSQQSSSSQPQADTSAQQQAPQTPNGESTHEEQTGTSNDRLFFALPNFLTIENADEVAPLGAGEKFKVVTRSAFDYIEYPWYGALAGISQAENSEPGYGQGLKGYAKRYGAAFGDGTIENFWTSAILPSALHQDPRFYQQSDGGFTGRAVYAASRIFVTRSDSRHPEFNASEIFGSLIAAVISTYSYHPKADRNIGNTASVWGSEVGYDTITIEVKEFWPDIHRKISHKSNANPAPTPAHWYPASTGLTPDNRQQRGGLDRLRENLEIMTALAGVLQ